MNNLFNTGFSKLLTTVCTFIYCMGAYANDTHALRADSHAPSGVLGDHTHHQGEVMLSYRYMEMYMDENRDGSDRLSNSEVFSQGYMVTPEDMKMKMHMFGAMYAPSDQLTLMAMLSYKQNQMHLETRNGQNFRTDTEGFGDTKLSALVPVYQTQHDKVHINLGISIPTGSINEKVNTPMGRVHAPYPMQMGSGSYDFLPAITWVKTLDKGSLGAQISAVMRSEENNNHYRLGNRKSITAWGAYLPTHKLSVSARLLGESWEDIKGNDKKIINPRISPTTNPSLRGGESASIGIGANYLINDKNRISFEVLKPVYQDLDGPQLETDLSANIAFQLNL